MSVCTTMILISEHDWKYNNYSKDEAKEDFLKVFPNSEFIAEWSTVLVFDIGKQCPQKVKEFKFFDKVFIQTDIKRFEITEVTTNDE